MYFLLVSLSLAASTSVVETGERLVFEMTRVSTGTINPTLSLTCLSLRLMHKYPCSIFSKASKSAKPYVVIFLTFVLFLLSVFKSLRSSFYCRPFIFYRLVSESTCYINMFS